MDDGHPLTPGIGFQHHGSLGRIDCGKTIVARRMAVRVRHVVNDRRFRLGQAQAVTPVPGVTRARNDADISTIGP